MFSLRNNPASCGLDKRSSLEGREAMRVSSKEVKLKQLAKCGLDRRHNRKGV